MGRLATPESGSEIVPLYAPQAIPTDANVSVSAFVGGAQFVTVYITVGQLAARVHVFNVQSGPTSTGPWTSMSGSLTATAAWASSTQRLVFRWKERTGDYIRLLVTTGSSGAALLTSAFAVLHGRRADVVQAVTGKQPEIGLT